MKVSNKSLMEWMWVLDDDVDGTGWAFGGTEEGWCGWYPSAWLERPLDSSCYNNGELEPLGAYKDVDVMENYHYDHPDDVHNDQCYDDHEENNYYYEEFDQQFTTEDSSNHSWPWKAEEYEKYYEPQQK